MITKQAKNILSAIQKHIKKEGRSPSIREISQVTSLSSRQVLKNLYELESEGYIRRNPYRTRTIQLLSKNERQKSDVSYLPLIGAAAGGPAILAQQNIEEYIPVSTKMIGSDKSSFLLKVKGSSMEPYLDNGDIAIVKKQDLAEKGDIIVASIEHEAIHEFESTIKIYYPQNDHVILKPINKEFEPLLVEGKNLHIQGIVKGVIKNLD